MFYANYVRLCNSVNKTPSAVALEIGIQKSTVTRWSHGTKPNFSTAQKVADYFGVSVEVLTGEEDKKEKPAPEGELVHLTNAEKKVLDLFQKIPEAERDNMLLAVEVALRSRGLLE